MARAKGTNVDSDMESKSAKPRYVFDVGRRRFWKQIARDEWIELTQDALRRDLMKQGFSHKITGAQKLSPLDDKIREIENESRVMEARRIAGWHAGVHEMGGDPVLVPRALKLLVPRDGGSDGHRLVAAILEGLLDGVESTEETPRRFDQRDNYLAWTQDTLRSLYAGKVTNGLAFALAGEPDCGKSRLLAMTKAMFGEKIGKPYDWMIGKEDFNKELFEACLLAIDDENANRTPDARRQLGGNVKKVVANEDNKLRGMQSDGLVVQATWRLWFNVNYEEGALLVMPQFTGDIIGKFMLLKGYVRRHLPAADDVAGWEEYRRQYPALSAWWDAALSRGTMSKEELTRCWPMPMPSDTLPEQEKFWATVKAELPAFVFWLLEKYVPPLGVVGGRFRVRPCAHPDILGALQEFAPHVHLWRLMERAGNVWRKLVRGATADEAAVWEDRSEWKGSAEELKQLLRDETNGLTKFEREREVSGESYIGQRLGEAKTHWGEAVVSQGRSGKARWWVLRRRPDITG